MKKQNIFLPIETSSRELDYKIILAAKLYTSSKRLFIGENSTLNHVVNYCDKGVYIGKSFITPYILDDTKNLKNLKKNNIDIIYLDEEGAIYTNGEVHWKNILLSKFNPSVLNSNDTLLTWGEFQKNVYSNVNHTCEIVNAGTPRLTLLSKYSEILIKPASAPENYILINTNFGFSINMQGLTYFVNSDVKTNQDSNKDLDYKFGIWSHSNITLSNYVSMIYQLRKRFPKKSIVIRPHPSEDKLFYEKMFKNFPSILVDNSETASDWMKYADVVIADGSTSAIEAYFLNRNVINYIPNKNEEYSIKLPNMIGEEINNINDLLNTLESLFSNSITIKRLTNKSYLMNMIYNFEDDIDSFEIISDLIDKRYTEMSIFSKKSFKVAKVLFDIKILLKNFIRKRLFYKRHIIHSKMGSKFQNFQQDDIVKRIDRAFKLFNKEYQSITFYGNDLLIIE